MILAILIIVLIVIGVIAIALQVNIQERLAIDEIDKNGFLRDDSHTLILSPMDKLDRQKSLLSIIKRWGQHPISRSYIAELLQVKESIVKRDIAELLEVGSLSYLKHAGQLGAIYKVNPVVKSRIAAQKGASK